MPEEPVERIPKDDPARPLQPGMALCLSGGGYRAMVFHVGAIWRLYEAGLLKGMKRISSVSGGSITAGLLGLKWSRLSFDPARMDTDFVPEFVKPIRELASMTIDAESIILGLLLPGKIADRVADAYDDQLYRGATLQALPDPAAGAPHFVINATSVQSGALWRFSRPYMRDWRVGEVKNPDVRLAVAVAASSAFPPVLSPYVLKLDPDSFTPNSGDGLQRPPFTSRAILTDGGVYDNLGLETIWKVYDTILASDAGGKMGAEEEPKADWAQHSYRIFNMVDDQVRSRRKTQLVGSYGKTHKGAYWGIRSDITHYELADALPCPADRTLALAGTPTRLKRMDERLQERLINWGYAVCDAALRKHLNRDLATPVAKPKGFPYPAAGV